MEYIILVVATKSLASIKVSLGGHMPLPFILEGIMKDKVFYLVGDSNGIIAIFTDYSYAFDYCKKNKHLMVEIVESRLEE